MNAPWPPNGIACLSCLTVEADIFDLEVVQGEIPASIAGTFYRVGPDPQFPPLLGTDMRFNGDGMVSLFRFKDGRVDFKSRWVQTDKFKLERAARRALLEAVGIWGQRLRESSFGIW